MKPINLATPHLIIMVGIPGSGKSFFAEHFSTTFNAPLVSAEFLESILSSDDESLTSLTEHILNELLKTNQTIVFDGDSSTRTNRLSLAKLAKNKGYEPLFVWAQTESAAAKQRATHSRRMNAMTSAEFDDAIKKFTPPNASEKALVISGKHTYASQLKIVLSRIASERQNVASQRAEPSPPVRRTFLIR